MKKRDIWAAIFWAITGLSIAIKSLTYKVGTLGHPESGFLPFWTGIGIFLLSMGTIVFSLKPSTASPFFPEEGSLRRIITTFLSILAYIFLVGRLGFLLSTLLLMAFLLKAIYPQSWLKTIIFSILVSVLSSLVFIHWLKVQLPKGWVDF